MPKDYYFIHSPSGALTLSSAIKAQQRFAVVRTSDKAVVVFDYYYEKRKVYGYSYVFTPDRIQKTLEHQGEFAPLNTVEEVHDAAVGILARHDWASEDFLSDSKAKFLFDEEVIEGFNAPARGFVHQGRYLQELEVAV